MSMPLNDSNELLVVLFEIGTWAAALAMAAFTNGKPPTSNHPVVTGHDGMVRRWRFAVRERGHGERRGPGADLEQHHEQLIRVVQRHAHGGWPGDQQRRGERCKWLRFLCR